MPPSGRDVLLELLASAPVARVLEVDVSVPAAEPETEPDAEPDTEPEALRFDESDDVAVLVDESVLWLADVVDVELASADEGSLIVLLLLWVSREHPGPNASAAASNAVAPNRVMFFFMIVSSLMFKIKPLGNPQSCPIDPRD